MNISMESTISWLLEGESWIRFNTLSHLLNYPQSHPSIQDSYQDMIHAHEVQGLLHDIQGWEDTILTRHNDANHPIHKLSFLAEIGVSGEEPAIRNCLPGIMVHTSQEGPFQILSNYPTTFGGSGKDEWLWALCDAPLIIYSLAKFGLIDQPQVRIAFDSLMMRVRADGWPCAATEKLGKFHGPGKASSPCPYANLLMLKAAAAMHVPSTNPAVSIGIETLLSLWENSLLEKPYLFKMGTDFRKLKAPFIWYDILHILDVLSCFTSAFDDPRFLDMVRVVMEKMDEQGRFSSESIWTKWKGWEFCQKKEPSRWVTLIVLKILKKAEMLDINPNLFTEILPPMPNGKV